MPACYTQEGRTEPAVNCLNSFRSVGGNHSCESVQSNTVEDLEEVTRVDYKIACAGCLALTDPVW